MKSIKRGLKITAGCFVTLLGIIIMPIPGPGGAPVALAGLAILATEVKFAERLRGRFLAMHNHYLGKIPAARRAALIAGVLTVYALVTTGFWWFWAASKS